MTEHKVEVVLPGSLYEQLWQIAEASQWTLQEVLLRTIQTGMPPSLRNIPGKYHSMLLELNRLDDEGLWRAGQKPSETGNEHVAAMTRAYAMSLLRWRGHPIPGPTDLSP